MRGLMILLGVVGIAALLVLGKDVSRLGHRALPRSATVPKATAPHVTRATTVARSGGDSNARILHPTTPLTAAHPDDAPDADVSDPDRRVGEVHGVFVDEAGAGVLGVSIRVSFARRHSSGYPFHMGGRSHLTDSSGTFTFQAPRGADWCDIRCTPPDGFVPPADRRIGECGGTWPVARYRLVDAAHIDGTVIRGDGTPVHGCAVRAVWRGVELFDCHVHTDASGRFQLPVPEGTPHVTVAVDAIGYAESLGFPMLPPLGRTGDASLANVRLPGVVPGASVRVVLPRAVAATVHALGPDSQPLEPGVLRVYEECDGALVRTLYCRKPVCRVGGLAPGLHRFEFHPGDEDLAPAVAREVLPSTEPIVLRCARGAMLKGTLLAEDTDGFRVTWLGRCNHFRVDHASYNAKQIGPTVKSVGGAFTLRGLSPEPGALYVHRDGDPRCAYITNVQPGTESFAIRLETAGLSIRGVVREFDRFDYPCVRATRGPIRAEAEIAPDGSFAIVGLPPGRFCVELLAGPYPWRRGIAAVQDGVPADTEQLELHPR